MLVNYYYKMPFVTEGHAKNIKDIFRLHPKIWTD